MLKFLYACFSLALRVTNVRSVGCGVQIWNYMLALSLLYTYTLALRLLYALRMYGVRSAECGVQIWNYTLALRLLYAYTLALRLLYACFTTAQLQLMMFMNITGQSAQHWTVLLCICTVSYKPLTLPTNYTV